MAHPSLQAVITDGTFPDLDVETKLLQAAGGQAVPTTVNGVKAR